MGRRNAFVGFPIKSAVLQPVFVCQSVYVSINTLPDSSWFRLQVNVLNCKFLLFHMLPELGPAAEADSGRD